MRISEAAWLLLCLAGCSASAPAGGQDDTIDCALASAANFSHDCTVERTRQDGAELLVVHHPDGGFRRFKLLDHGKSLTAADGAQALAVARTADRVDVAIDGDRYRFPATMLSDDGAR
jgi:hypothetical protein